MKYIVILTLLLISSCATHSNKPSLYEVYVSYKTTMNRDNALTRYTEYFNPKFSKEEVIDESAIPYLLFKERMQTENNHFEKMVSEERGCLTVDGLDNEKGEPVEFNIEYVLIKGKWYINTNATRYLSNVNELSKSAKCPSETVSF